MKRSTVLSRLETTLERRREALRRSVVEGLRSAELSAAPFVGDSIDAAIDAAHGEISSQLAEAESRELAAVENALARLQSGEYGQCEECSEAIPLARLQALPYATLCIACQRTAERALESQPAAGWLPRIESSDEFPLGSFQVSSSM
jgi:DnaK suppressor protein